MSRSTSTFKSSNVWIFSLKKHNKLQNQARSQNFKYKLANQLKSYCLIFWHNKIVDIDCKMMAGIKAKEEG